MSERRPGKYEGRAGERCQCELYCFNEALVSRLRENLPDADRLIRAGSFFAALGNRTRLAVLHCLCQAEELCVCDIANALKMNLSTVSHQLRQLRDAGFVSYRSQGKMAFYRLTEQRIRRLIEGQLCGKQSGQ